MHKTELVAALAEKANVSKSTAADVLNAFETVVTNELIAGGEVRLTGFGTFYVVDKAERQGRNPKTGEALVIAAHTTPKFKAGTDLKKAVNL